MSVFFDWRDVILEHNSIDMSMVSIWLAEAFLSKDTEVIVQKEAVAYPTK